MIEIYDRNRKKLAVLENAFNIKESIRINAVSFFEFALPDTDLKNEYCQKFHLIRFDGGEIYRIIGEKAEESETGYITYECEHVIALLMNTAIPEFDTIGGLGIFTEDVIRHYLDMQTEKHWVLHECDFRRQFEYGLEKENILSALFAVANRFVDMYQWIFDTSVYPYRVSLKQFDENRNPDFYVRRGHNRLRLSRQSDSKYLCTRLYAYGAGEGINQLTIRNVNNGVNYLQSLQEYTDRYGIIETVWTDRRYTDEQSLFEAALVMLNELQEPYIEYETEVTGNPKIGDVVQIVEGLKSYVVEVENNYDEIPQKTIKIANRPRDIAGTISDLADRLRIESTYSQGATQIYADTVVDNTDSANAVNIPMFIPSTLININYILCKIRLTAFRAYTPSAVSAGNMAQSTTTVGSTAQSTSTNGSTSAATSSVTGSTGTAGGTSVSTSSNGSTTDVSGNANTSTNLVGGTTTNVSGSTTGNTFSITTMTANVNIMYGTAVAHHTHGLEGFVTSHQHNVASHGHMVNNHSHNVNTSHNHMVNAHSHTVNTSHSHSVNSHSHTVNISHSHTVNIQHSHTVNTSHTHDLPIVIRTAGNAQGFELFVNGQSKAHFNSRDAEIDITEYLLRDGRIPRDTWHTIGIRPYDLARVELSYNVMGFVQSRSGRLPV